MSDIINCRCSPRERKQLRIDAQAAGFENFSDYMRFRLGLPRGEGRTAPLPDALEEVLDQPYPEPMKRLLSEMRADDEEAIRLLRRICNALKIEHTEPVHEQRPTLAQRQLEAVGFTR